MNYIIWREKESSDIDGLIITELPPIVKPKMRTEETKIDGVDGSVIENLGYEPYDKQIKIGLRGNYDIDEIMDYFDGTGRVVFSNENEKYYNATIVEQINYERLIRYRTATVKFHVQPYKYLLTETTYTLSSSEHRVINRGYKTSLPIIEMSGSGDVEISVNGKAIFTYKFGADSSVTIDSEKQDAYLGSVLKNRQMEGDFPTLKSGINTITWEGNITSMKVYPRSRWV